MLVFDIETDEIDLFYSMLSMNNKPGEKLLLPSDIKESDSLESAMKKMQSC